MMRKELIFVVFLACSKDPAPVAKEIPAEPVPSVAASVASATAPAPSAPETPPTAPSVTVAAPRGAPSGSAKSAVPTSPSSAPKSPALQPASNRVSGNHFTVDVASPGCVAGSECAVTLRLEATAGYHINKEYPYKLALSATPNVEFLGRDPASTSVFSKSAGDFVIADEHVGTMTARLKPSAKGPTNIAGIYKMSVCTDANCQVEQTKISLDVPVQ